MHLITNTPLGTEFLGILCAAGIPHFSSAWGTGLVAVGKLCLFYLIFAFILGLNFASVLVNGGF